MNAEPYRLVEPDLMVVDHGPVNMTISAWRGEEPRPQAAEAGARRAVDCLAQLSRRLASARLAVAALDQAAEAAQPEVLRRMIAAVRALGEPDFTPLAAVAGAFSDLVKEAVLAAGADRVVVNNGGDIALRLPAGQRLRLGLVDELGRREVSHFIELGQGTGREGVEGVATSGLGGRSLTKGLASAVTCLAATAVQADAAATAVANASFAEDPAVERCRAEELDPLTDIAGHLVTLRVGRLAPATVDQALAHGLERARELAGRGLISGVVIFVQGRAAMWPAGLARPIQEP